jgi:PTS system ascorbate-specific IIA component
MSEKLAELHRLVSPSQVRAKVVVDDWGQAVDAAGTLLVEARACSPEYVSAMRQAVRDLGPYIVIAPGVAMPHARPEAGVAAPGVAIATLAHPVEFGHKANDPVDLVIAFAAVDKGAHLETLQAIVALLQDAPALAAVRAAETHEELVAALGCAGALANDEPIEGAD